MFKADDINRLAKVHQSDGGLTIITQNSYGYGDIIRLAAYATKIQQINQKPVTVIYLTTEQSDIVRKTLDHFQLDIQYKVEVGSIEKYKHMYTGLLRKNYAAAVGEALGWPRLTTKHIPQEKDYIAVWHPYNNLEPVEFAKMPVDKDQFFDVLTVDHLISFVDYTMDTDRVFEVIRNAKLCLGYEGLGQQIAYHYNKKIVTLSNWRDVSINTGGPESFITNDLDEVREILQNEYATCKETGYYD